MANPNNTYSLLRISGQDAKKLLQGQLTCHMDSISEGKLSYGALCNPQGRVISFFQITQEKEDYLLLMLQSMTDITITALKKYAVFYKVEITHNPLTDFFKLNSPIVNIQNKVPSIYPETSGKFLPHELNLDQIGAISFDKGCYTGQEIIARMHYRGKPKSHLYVIQLKLDAAPAPGADIYVEENNQQKTIGAIVDAAPQDNHHYLILAILNDAYATHSTLSIANNKAHS